MDKLEDGLLRGSRVYLSGPMDFVASRAAEKKGGWRNRVGAFLRQMGVIVFDPWEKPEVRGLHGYGAEGESTASIRDQWTYKPGADGADKRAAVGEAFWPALHIDLRMVDTSDFIICYCPTNIYSVGTPNEIILARSEFKPVLFVSPYVYFPTVDILRNHLKKDKEGLRLLNQLADEVPIKENKTASPSSWYTALISGEYFFDGFGFEQYKEQFDWSEMSIDQNERDHKPSKPLLPFISDLNKKLPEKWNRDKRAFVRDEDWLLWELKAQGQGAVVSDVHAGPGKPSKAK
jgi:hypothetical protein